MADENTPQIDYLIGILVRENSKEKYIPFTAKDTDHEKEMLLEFLEFVKKQSDYVIYHYHHYDKSQSKHKTIIHIITFSYFRFFWNIQIYNFPIR